MKLRAIDRRLAVRVTTFWSSLFFAQLCLSQAEQTPIPQSVRTMRQESATVELRSTLAGNMQDLDVTVDGFNKEADRLEQESLARDAKAYRERLKADLNNADLHFHLSFVLARLGQKRAAQDELETAVHLDQNLVKARNQLAILYITNGERTKAENEFQAAILSDPMFVEAKNNLAVLYAWTGRKTEAFQLFRDALDERPNYAEAHVNLGLVLAGEGKYPEAEKEVRLALRLTPDNLNALSALGMLKVKLSRGEEAVEILRKVAKQQPDSAGARSNLGMALVRDGFDLTGALEQFSEAIRLQPQSAPLHLNKGRVLKDLNRTDEARIDLEAACQIQPDYPEALFLLAQVEKQLGNIQLSTEALGHLVFLEPSNADAQLLLGRNLLSLGKTEEAIHHLQIAVGVNSNSQDALYTLAQALGKAGKPEAKLYMERFQQLKQQVETDDRVQTLGSYGLEAANARDWPQAVAHFKEAIELCGQCPSSADLHRNLGLVYVLKGDIESGRDELETVLRIKPNDTDARKALESLPVKKTAPH
jgi:tetratricopeptide (TPR) repeat protein